MTLLHHRVQKFLLYGLDAPAKSKCMRALQYQGPNQLEWVEVEDARIEAASDVVIRPTAVASCDLDWGIVQGRVPFPAPFILGHEFVGEIVASGAGVSRFKVGDRVSVAFQPSCGHCQPCGHGQSASCKDVAPTSMFGVGAVSGDWGGAFADLIRVPFADNMLLKLPKDLPAEWFTSVTDNVADAYRAVAPFIQKGGPSRVLVIGNYDSIPLYAIAFAKALGAEKITFCTQSEKAAANAAQLGAVVEKGGDWPARVASHDVVVCASQDPAALLTALRSTAAQGNCTCVGILDDDVEFPIRDMYMRGIHFHTGRVNGAAVHQEAVEWIKSGLIRPFDVDTAVVPWEGAVEALLNRPAAKLVAVRD